MATSRRWNVAILAGTCLLLALTCPSAAESATNVTVSSELTTAAPEKEIKTVPPSEATTPVVKVKPTTEKATTATVTTTLPTTTLPPTTVAITKPPTTTTIPTTTKAPTTTVMPTTLATEAPTTVTTKMPTTVAVTTKKTTVLSTTAAPTTPTTVAPTKPKKILFNLDPVAKETTPTNPPTTNTPDETTEAVTTGTPATVVKEATPKAAVVTTATPKAAAVTKPPPKVPAVTADLAISEQSSKPPSSGETKTVPTFVIFIVIGVLVVGVLVGIGIFVHRRRRRRRRHTVQQKKKQRLNVEAGDIVHTETVPLKKNKRPMTRDSVEDHAYLEAIDNKDF